MIDDSVLRKLREGDPDAVSYIAQRLERKALAQREIVKVWEAVVEGVQNGGNARVLVNFGVDTLSNASQDPETGKMYENLLCLQAFPTVDIAYVPTISIGAALARLSKGEISPRLDQAVYLRLAKKCLLDAVAKGDENTRKYAAEALRYVEGGDVKAELASIARNSDISALKEAAGDSICFLRVSKELEEARADRDFLLETVYADPTSPQRLYVECIFGAAETVLGTEQATEAGRVELEVAVKQLASFGAEPGEMADLFDRHSLKLIRTNVENALLHALTNGPAKAIKEAAAGGLERMGSDRVEEILERIVMRVGECTETGAIAAEALAGIRGKKVEIFEVRLPPPLPAKLRPQPQLQKPRLVQ